MTSILVCRAAAGTKGTENNQINAANTVDFEASSVVLEPETDDTSTCLREKTIEPQVVYVLSNPKHESQEGEETAPLSFIALVPSTEEQIITGPGETQDDGSTTYVALVPDSTHYAPPIVSQEDDCSLTLKELSAREKSKLIKRNQRQNTEFRDKEKAKTRKTMQEKRKDPAYRELERKKDRERRRLSRLNNNSLREKERARDREYRRRVKIKVAEPSKSTDDLESTSLESFMNEMDEKCQLLISCKPDDVCSEESIYNFHKSNFDEDLQNGGFSSGNERTDLIGQYGENVLQSEMITVKDTESRTLSNYMPFIS